MKEIILKIEEKEFEHDYRNYDGFIISTNSQTIKIGISSGQSCCESFGCIITNDTTEECIGTEIIRVEIVDEVLNNKEIDEISYSECGGTMFVNIVTNIGVLQFAAYNSHNGYYGHESVLVSKQLTEIEVF